MKLHMMTHGDSHHYEDDSSNHAVYSPPLSTPYYQVNAEYQRQTGYSGKYYDTTVGNSMVENTYLTTTAMDSTRPDIAPASYTAECEASALSNDDLLLRVAEEQLRPLIKEELRYTIQSKRAAKGLPSHVEIEYKVSEPEPETPTTLFKRQRRRERNKIAAAKCRFKKKILSEKLIEESEELENQNHKLKTEVQRLQEERQKLMFILNSHRPTCIVRSPSCSSPPHDFNTSPRTSPDFTGSSQADPSSSGFHKLSPESRSSSLDEDSMCSLTSSFTYPPYGTSDTLSTPVHKSVIVESRNVQSLSKQS